MKILFNQNMPKDLASYLPRHEVHRAAILGWDRLENGDLLQAAEEGGFQVFVTGDQSLAYQQNLSARKIAIIELSNNHWPPIKYRVEAIVTAVASIKKGDYCRIECPGVRSVRKQKH